VYFARKPHPMSAPVKGHQKLKAGLFSSARQKVASAAIQKKMDSGSIVITSEPAWKMGITFSSSTVQMAAGSP
jgi:hypothetical protein